MSSEEVKITEGKATILFSKAEDVFYNPVQQVNRDMSIAVIKTWAKIFISEKQEKLKRQRASAGKSPIPSSSESATDEDKTSPASVQYVSTQPEEEIKDVGIGALPEIKVRVLEALSATGLRSIRYGKELSEWVRCIVANDISPTAVESIKKNVEFNGLSTDYVRPNRGDACSFMYQHREGGSRFDVVDLDPYGTASPFIDAAVQAVSDGGLLCVTCTDMAVLAGKYPETCYAKYGSVPLRSDACHEMALRILLQTLQNSAARYKRVIVPMICCSIDFYIRVFVRVYTSPSAVKKAASNMSMLYQCVGCKSFYHSPLNKITISDKGGTKYGLGRPPHDAKCDICGNAFQIGGPFWSAPIHDKNFVSALLEHLNEAGASEMYGTHARMLGMSTVISEEIEEPLYYNLGSLSQIVKATTIPLVKFTSALLNANYQVSFTHCSGNCVKTNAPPHAVWDIMRAWAKETNVVEKNMAENAPGRKIISMVPQLNVNFTEHPQANPESRKVKLVRYEDHHGQNWGPKARAKRRAEGNSTNASKKVSVESTDAGK